MQIQLVVDRPDRDEFRLIVEQVADVFEVIHDIVKLHEKVELYIHVSGSFESVVHYAAICGTRCIMPNDIRFDGDDCFAAFVADLPKELPF